MAAASRQQLLRCARDLARAVEQRDSWIVRMRRAGYPLRQIANAAGLSPQGVSRVLDREPPPTREAGQPERELQRWTHKAHDATLERTRLLVALQAQCSQRELAELSGLSRSAVQHHLARAQHGEPPRIVRARP